MKEQTLTNQERPKTNERKILYFILATAVVNIILWFVAAETNTKYPSQGSGQSLFGKLLILYFGVVVVGFIAGLFVSLIPFKGLSFGQKYLRSSLLSIWVLSLLLLVFIIRSMILFYEIISINALTD